MKNSESKLALILGVLTIIVIALGAYLFSEKTGGTATQKGDNSQLTSSTKEPVTPTGATKSEVVGSDTYPPTGTLPSVAPIEVVRALILSLSEKPTAGELKSYSDGLSKLLVFSPIFDVTGCVATPNVMQVTLGKTVMISNGDDKEHVLTYGKEKVVIAPKSKAFLSLNFQGLGAYAFQCDYAKEFAGVFVVTP